VVEAAEIFCRALLVDAKPPSGSQAHRTRSVVPQLQTAKIMLLVSLPNAMPIFPVVRAIWPAEAPRI